MAGKERPRHAARTHGQGLVVGEEAEPPSPNLRNHKTPTYDYGNLVDNIRFEKAYPLTHDGNGNTAGTLPQQSE